MWRKAQTAQMMNHIGATQGSTWRRPNCSRVKPVSWFPVANGSAAGSWEKGEGQQADKRRQDQKRTGERLDARQWRSLKRLGEQRTGELLLVVAGPGAAGGGMIPFVLEILCGLN
jgi:hypothetical protein